MGFIQFVMGNVEVFTLGKTGNRKMFIP